jgi:hypothetical protein
LIDVLLLGKQGLDLMMRAMMAANHVVITTVIITRMISEYLDGDWNS